MREIYGKHFVLKLPNGFYRAFFNSTKSIGDYANEELARDALNKRDREAASLLSPQEKAVLIRTAKGEKAGSVAYYLGISNSTVEFHRKKIIEKLNAENSAHAITKAFLLGILSQADF